MTTGLIKPIKELLPRGPARKLKRVRLRIFELFGSRRFSFPALHGMDHFLLELLADIEVDERIFLEVGGNDGLQQSNTYALAWKLGWSGVLIEANPTLAAEARRNRPESKVVCALLTRPDNAGRVIGLAGDDLMAAISTSHEDLLVATTSLDLVFDGAMGGFAPTLMIIDVEGHELDVLAGFAELDDVPRFIVVETDKLEAVGNLLEPRFVLERAMTLHDYLFIRVD